MDLHPEIRSDRLKEVTLESVHAVRTYTIYHENHKEHRKWSVFVSILTFRRKKEKIQKNKHKQINKKYENDGE